MSDTATGTLVFEAIPADDGEQATAVIRELLARPGVALVRLG